MLDNAPSELQTLHCWKTLFHWVLHMPPLWGTPNHSSPPYTSCNALSAGYNYSGSSATCWCLQITLRGAFLLHNQVSYKCVKMCEAVDLAKPWEHLKPTCFAAARTSNMSLHTSGHVVAPKSGLFACHHASNADGEPRKNDTLSQ